VFELGKESPRPENVYKLDPGLLPTLRTLRKAKAEKDSHKIIATPLELPSAIAPGGVWDELTSIVDRYLWLPEQDDYMLLKLWIAWTYVKTNATAAFHLLFSGRTESGKNQGLGLVYLCANTGYSSSSMKPAGLFRLVNGRPDLTLILEEFSIPYRPDEDTVEVVELLLAMIARGKKVIRVERIDGVFVPCEYSIFGGVAFSTKHIERLQEDLRNRCIVISTVKAPLENKKPLLAVVDTDETKRIRAKLVGVRDEILKNPLKFHEPRSFKRNYRFKDIFMMLAPVAHYFGKSVELERALLKQAQDYAEAKRESFTGDVVGALVRAYEERKDPKQAPSLDELLKLAPAEIETGYGKDKKVSKKMVAGVLKKVGASLVEERTKDARTTYVVLKPAFLLDLKDEYGLGVVDDPCDPYDPSLRGISQNDNNANKQPLSPISPIEGSHGSDGSSTVNAAKRLTLEDLRRKQIPPRRRS
jgi:hypothetical protein